MAAANTLEQTARLLSAKEAAQYLGISERSLHRLKVAGQIPFVPVGFLVRYRAESLAAWAASAERCETPADVAAA